MRPSTARFSSLAGLFWLLLVIWLATGCASTARSDLERFEFSRAEMGLPFRIVLYASDKANAERGAEAAFARIKELNDILSDYDAESELSRLSRSSGTGSSVKVSDDLWNVLSAAQHYSTLSDGAFDVSVGPVVNLWRKARREHRLPDRERLTQARRAVNYRAIHLNRTDHTVLLSRPEMRLDLGAIAKGYALQEAINTLRRAGIRSALVTGGGDMAVSDPPPGRKGWRIEIAPLDIPNAPAPQFVLIKNCGLATSGDVFQHIEIDGIRYSHIVDPHTGMGLTDHSLVTVIAPDGMTADALSTAVSVLGPRRGLALIEKEQHASLHMVRLTDGKIEAIESSRFSAYFDPGK